MNFGYNFCVNNTDVPVFANLKLRNFKPPMKANEREGDGEFRAKGPVYSSLWATPHVTAAINIS
jgi:hypothetical protein